VNRPPAGETPPLAGIRVVVTRAADRARDLTDRLEALGATVVGAPTIATADPADGGAALAAALDRLESFDWLVVTSPNGAERVAGAVRRCGTRGPRVAAVGAATAAALGLGRPADLVPAHAVAEALVEAFPHGTGHVLVVQGDLARLVVAEGLTGKGWQVETAVAYRTQPARPPAELVGDVAAADVVVFTSGSTVRGFLAAFGRDACPPLVVSIGPVTTGVAEQAGLPVTRTAAPHTVEGLVTAVCEAVAARGSTG
jgi:uroporphyrinogen-III synthase